MEGYSPPLARTGTLPLFPFFPHDRKYAFPSDVHAKPPSCPCRQGGGTLYEREGVGACPGLERGRGYLLLMLREGYPPPSSYKNTFQNPYCGNTSLLLLR